MTGPPCPICGSNLDPKLAKKIGIDSASAEMLHELAHAGKLVRLVQLGSVAENILRPEKLGIEAEVWKVANQMADKAKQMVKDVAEASEEGRTEIVERYEKELAEDRERLESIQEEHKDALEGIRKDLDALGKKIVGPGIGKVGEAITIKDLQSAFTEDDFSPKRSDQKGTDIIADVRQDGAVMGKVCISVKYQEEWKGAFLKQLKDDMRSEGTRWGILVTKVFPSNAINDRAYLTKDWLFIVKPEYASVAYYGLREAVRAAWEAMKQTKTIQERLLQEQRIIEGLREWVSGESLRALLDALDRAREAADQAQRLVRLWQEYGRTQGDKVYEEAQKVIEELTRGSGLVTELRERLQPSALVAPTPPALAKARKRRSSLQA